MPELPEVETVVLGIKDQLINQIITGVEVFHHKLRHLIQTDLESQLKGLLVQGIYRRAKYIIIASQLDLIVHLGMSGKITLKDHFEKQKHDHIVLTFSNGIKLVYNDPRRFGMFFWVTNAHKHLSHLGVEPLNSEFTGDYLYQKLASKHSFIKKNIMDQSIVVGVGNIYACEALYHANLSPFKTQLSLDECKQLVLSIKTILERAILQGGTTLKDYRNADDKLGYFQQSLAVYAQKKCPKGHQLYNEKIASRSTFYCKKCQPLPSR